MISIVEDHKGTALDGLERCSDFPFQSFDIGLKSLRVSGVSLGVFGVLFTEQLRNGAGPDDRVFRVQPCVGVYTFMFGVIVGVRVLFVAMLVMIMCISVFFFTMIVVIIMVMRVSMLLVTVLIMVMGVGVFFFVMIVVIIMVVGVSMLFFIVVIMIVVIMRFGMLFVVVIMIS